MLERLKNWLLLSLFCAVDTRKVFSTVVHPQTRAESHFLGSERISVVQMRSLKAEVKFLKETVLWKILQETLADHARKTMFERSTSFDDMKSGKLLLLAVEMQRKIVEAIDKSVV